MLFALCRSRLTERTARKQGESISKQCRLIQAQIETTDTKKQEAQETKAESYAQLNIKLMGMTKEVLAQQEKLETIQSLQLAMREQIHRQDDYQAQQNGKFANLIAAIGSVDINQDDVRSRVYHMGTELTKQNQTLERIENDLARAIQSVDVGAVPGPSAADSGSVADAAAAQDDSIKAKPSVMHRERGCTCST